MGANNILYLSYTGLLEPLGQSQVLNYLQGLSNNNNIRLITFEKSEDLKDQEEFNELKAICKDYHIDWIPLTYHKNPRLLATVYDMMSFLLKTFSIITKEKINIVHCRGYIPTFIGYFLKKMHKVPFIFDMRAFWPDEMVTAGRLKDDSLMYRMLKKMEDQCLKEANHVITLTHTAERYLCERYDQMDKKITTIPTCVNLDLFSLNDRESTGLEKNEFVLGSVGTVSGWFKIDWLFSLYRELKRQHPMAPLQFLSRDDPNFIKKQAEKNGIEPAELKIESCRFEEVPSKMRKMSVGAFFFEPGFSKLGSAPTRMGEFLACGVPCVANRGVGDVAHIIDKYNVGVVVNNNSDEQMKKAVNELKELQQEPELSQRCRRAAEEWFAIEQGVERYDMVYRDIAKVKS